MDFGDGYISPWSSYTGVFHVWTDLGYYDIRAQARCSTHTAIVTEWSNPRVIQVVETITEPGQPHGPPTTQVGLTETYCGGTTTSSCGHGRQRQWRINAEELPWGYDACIQYSFPAPGIYNIRVRGRCSTHTEAVSGWSIPFKVTVN
jgi:hypothetical protein